MCDSCEKNLDWHYNGSQRCRDCGKRWIVWSNWAVSYGPNGHPEDVVYPDGSSEFPNGKELPFHAATGMI